MMKNKIVVSLATAVLMMVSASCSTDTQKNELADTHTIKFETQGIETRGSQNPENGYELFNTGAKFGVLAYTLPDGVFDPSLNTPNLLYNAMVTKVGVGSYTYDPLAVWPMLGKAKFIAYHPHNSTFAPGAIELSPAGNYGYPEVTIDLQKAKGKLDFATAELPELSPTINDDPAGVPPRSNYYVNFHFKRQFAELFFRAKAVDMPDLVNIYIREIGIKNVSTKGKYTFGKANPWTLDPINNLTLSFGSVGVAVNKLKYVDVINPNNTSGTDRQSSVVMLPAKYNDVVLQIVYMLEYMKPEGGCEYRLEGTKNLPLTVNWEAAKTYAYDIDCGYYEAVGEITNIAFTVKGWEPENVNTELK